MKDLSNNVWQLIHSDSWLDLKENEHNSPYRCACVIGNLIRHYKEKHPETEPPEQILAAGEAALREQQQNGTDPTDNDDLVIDVS